MVKNLIIGGFTGYTYNQLKPWVESINEVCSDNVDKVLVVGDTDDETRRKLVEQDVQLVDMPNMNLPIHVARFVSIYEYLREIYHEYEYVVTTDVKDVYFQSDPFRWLEQHLPYGKHLVAGSESIRYRDEPWGDQNLREAYGPYIYELFKDNIIYNVGVIGGKSEYVKDLVFNIFTNAVNRPIPIVDQAVFNILINTQPYKDITLFAEQRDGWACHAGTTADPSKIEQFRPHLDEAEPIWQNGLVTIGEPSFGCYEDTPFSIVHQYDRVPEWKEHIRNKYKQEDDSPLFIYKT